MLFRTVSLNSTVCWLTIPICSRREASVTFRISTPSIRMPPPRGMEDPGDRAEEGVLPRPPRPDDGDHRPDRNAEVDLLEDRLALRGVPEIDLIEDDLLPDRGKRARV